MNKQLKPQTLIAPIALGIGLILGAGNPAQSHPDHYRSNYHRQSFIDIQPFRSLNVRPRYYNRSSNYNSSYYERPYHPRQRRVHRRGFRRVDSGRYRDYRPEGTYIRIRIR